MTSRISTNDNNKSSNQIGIDNTNEEENNTTSPLTPKLSYSQTLQLNIHEDLEYIDSTTDLIMEDSLNRQTEEISWLDHIIEAQENNLKNTFEYTSWTRDKIISALNNITGITEFFTYKLTTRPLQHSILNAIFLKFKYLDKAFFTTFTGNKKVMLAHQIEFNKLMQDAINNYKTKNKITITTKEIRNNIQYKLYQKLIIDYITSLNFREMDNYQIA